MRRLRVLLAVMVLLPAWLWAQPPVDYYVSLADPGKHLIRIRIHLAGTSKERDLKLPVWNALYQIRDFAQYVRWVRAKDASGRSLQVRKMDKTTWRVYGAESGADFEYEIYADNPGPYGTQFNHEHAFLNLAQVLMYPEDSRDALMTVTFTDLPPNWQVATQLPSLRPGEPSARGIFTARNYDRLADNPIEIGAFQEMSFEEGGALYRIAIHANPADYNSAQIKDIVRKVVTTQVWWMNDRPFGEYLFIYHFLHRPGEGGMEHAYSTAIDVSVDRLQDDPLSFPTVTAHEFFHLWNVKRIRPASLEPVDYLKENYTRALWFSEGVTNTVADYTLLRAGLMDQNTFLRRLALDIRMLESRPAHRAQSVEEASLDTWFDKYPQYRLPERSIDYYNKGEILGILLDLAVRDATRGQKSLREVFHWMNRHYFYDSRYFPDSDGVRQAVEGVTGKDFGSFFRDYVAGTADLPYNALLKTVGLRLQVSKTSFADPGFIAIKNFDQPPFVVSVEEGSEAERQGLRSGDTILAMNGKPATTEVESVLNNMRPGETLKLRVQGPRGQREIKIRLGSREVDDYGILLDPAATAEQQARRAAWLQGVAQAPGDQP